VIQSGSELHSNKFEKDSHEIYKELLNSYLKAANSSAWKSKNDILVERLSFLPTDPFSKRLMELFDYEYVVQSKSIHTIIEKSLLIRQQLEPEMRYIKVRERYFYLPFIARNSKLRSLKVYNNEGELCYHLKCSVKLKLSKLLVYLNPLNTNSSAADIYIFKQKIIKHKRLEIYNYSKFINLSVTSRKSYYDFFCDYYAKLQFRKDIKSDTIARANLEEHFRPSSQALEEILNLSSSQQVLWGYFLFKLIGFKLRINAEVSSLTRFLMIVNKANFKEYRNSYFYKLASKAPYIKENPNLISDLKIIREQFIKSNLPTKDIDDEIAKLLKEK